VVSERTGHRLTRVKGKWLRVLDMPNPLHEVTGRHGIQWDHMGEGLERNAPYDVESMAIVRKLGGIKGLAKRMLPHLYPDRLDKVISRVEAACHRKQRAAGDFKATPSELLIPVFNARRKSKSEKRKLRNDKRRSAIKELKALLRNK
jgi:hypothetical protein